MTPRLRVLEGVSFPGRSGGAGAAAAPSARVGGSRPAVSGGRMLVPGLSLLLSRLRRRAAAITSSHPDEAREPREQQRPIALAWRWAALVGAVLALACAGCSGNLPPIPPLPPGPPGGPPAPPGPTCPELGVPWCHEAGMNCGACQHQPPGAACPILADPCPGPAPTPTPPPVAGVCNPDLAPALSAPEGPATSWPRAADQTTASPWKQVVWSAVRAAQASCPSAWAGDCLAGGTAYIDAGYRLISYHLQRAGVAASQAIVDGRRMDHLWVSRAPGSRDWNGTKLFEYGQGCLITGDGAFAVHGWYTWTGGTPGPTPQPPPSPPGACPHSPCPDLVWTEATLPDGWSGDELGQPRMQFNSSLYVGRWIDNTLVVVRNEPYCAAIGLSPYADGQPRASCPLRPDGHAERVALELWASGGGFRLEGKDGYAGCERHPTNPVMFAPSGGNCRLCTTRTFKDGRPLCSEWR